MTEPSPPISPPPSTPSSRRRMALMLGRAIALAALVTLGGILPAEYNRDPLGLGRLTGISALWAPEELHLDAASQQMASASLQTGPLQSLEVEIPLGPGGDPAGKDQLEYKVRLPKGGAILYRWEAVGARQADEFYAEFHGHTEGKGEAMTVAEYRKESEVANSGALTAPFAGIHGWYFLNTSEKPVTVRLKVVGFFTVIAPGAAGNEAAITGKLAPL